MKQIQIKKKPIQISIPIRKYSQNKFGQLESQHIQHILHYLPIDMLIEMILIFILGQEH